MPYTYKVKCNLCGEEYDKTLYAEPQLCKKCRFHIDDVKTVANKKEVDIVRQLISIEDLIA